MKIKLHLEGNKNMTHNQEKESFKILLLVLFQRERMREKVSNLIQWKEQSLPLKDLKMLLQILFTHTFQGGHSII